MEIFQSKIRPDLSKFSDQELQDILIKKNGSESEIDIKNMSRNQLTDKIIEIWSNEPIGDDIVCPICLDTVLNNNYLSTNCSHYFHSTCIFKYILNKQSIKNFKQSKEIKCPQCRGIIFNNKNQTNQDSTNTLDQINIQNNQDNNDNNDNNSNYSDDDDEDENIYEHYEQYGHLNLHNYSTLNEIFNVTNTLFSSGFNQINQINQLNHLNNLNHLNHLNHSNQLNSFNNLMESTLDIHGLYRNTNPMLFSLGDSINLTNDMANGYGNLSDNIMFPQMIRSSIFSNFDLNPQSDSGSEPGSESGSESGSQTSFELDSDN